MADVEDQECASGSPTEQLLADISSVSVTESSSEELSSRLASLPPMLKLSVQELDTVTTLAAELVRVGAMDVGVSVGSLHYSY